MATKSSPKIGQAIKLAFEVLNLQGKDTLHLETMCNETAKMLLVLEYIANKYDTYNSAQIGQALNFAWATVNNKADYSELVNKTELYLKLTTEIQELDITGIITKANQEEIKILLEYLKNGH